MLEGKGQMAKKTRRWWMIDIYDDIFTEVPSSQTHLDDCCVCVDVISLIRTDSWLILDSLGSKYTSTFSFIMSIHGSIHPSNMSKPHVNPQICTKDQLNTYKWQVRHSDHTHRLKNDASLRHSWKWQNVRKTCQFLHTQKSFVYFWQNVL